MHPALSPEPCTEAVDPDEMETVKDLVDDYLERHEEGFDEFDNPEDLYESIAEHMESLEVGLLVARAACVHACNLLHCRQPGQAGDSTLWGGPQVVLGCCAGQGQLRGEPLHAAWRQRRAGPPSPRMSGPGS